MSAAIIPFVWEYKCSEPLDFTITLDPTIGGPIVIPRNVRIQNGMVLDHTAVTSPQYGTLEYTATGWYYTPSKEILDAFKYEIKEITPREFDIQPVMQAYVVDSNDTEQYSRDVPNPPYDSFSFSLDYWGKSTAVTKTVVIISSKKLPPPTIAATVKPTSCYPGQQYTISWTTTMSPYGAIVQVDNTGSYAVGTAAVLTIPDDAVTGVTIAKQVTLVNSAGVVVATSVVNIAIIEKPSISISSDESILYAGDSYNINWSSVNAPVDGYVIINKDPNHQPLIGTQSYTIPNSDTPGTAYVYTAYLYSADNTLIATKSTTVIVKATPTIALTSDSNVVYPGDSYNINWTSINAPVDGYVLVDADNAHKQTNGTLPKSAPANAAVGSTIQHVAKLYKSNGKLIATSSVDVLIAKRPTIKLSASSVVIYPGDSYTIDWISTDSPVDGYATVTGLNANQLPTGNTVFTTEPTIVPGSTITVIGRLYNSKGMLVATDSINVTISTKPIITIFATPDFAYPGDTNVVNWSVANPPAGGYILINDDTTHKLTVDNMSVNIPNDAAIGTVLTYTANLYDASGKLITSKSTSITVFKKPTIELSTDVSSVYPGESYVVNWTSIDAPVGAYVKITNVSENKPITGSNTYTTNVTDAAGTIFTIFGRLYNSSGRELAVGLINVTVLKQPTINVTAPAIIYPGDQYNVNWTSTDAPIDGYTTINIDTTQMPTSGSKAYTSNSNDAPGLQVVYTVKLYKANGTLLATGSTTVTVATRPGITITANPNAIYPGDSSAVNWTVSNPPANGYILINDNVNHRPFISGDTYIAPNDAVAGSIVTYTATLYDATDNIVTSNSAPITIVKKPTIALTAPATIYPGDSYTVNWTSSDAPVGAYVKITGTTTNKPISGSNVYTSKTTDAVGTVVNITGKIYNSAGRELASSTVSVTIIKKPTISVTAPATIYPGDAYVVNWTTVDAPNNSYVTINADLSHRLTTSSEQYTSDASAVVGSTITYTAKLYRSDDTLLGTGTATIKVIVRPTVAISTSPSLVYPGDKSAITWSVSNPPVNGYVLINDNPTQRPMASSDTYTVPVDAAIGTIIPFTATLYSANRAYINSNTATITVIKKPTITLTAPATIYPGDSYTVNWTSSDAPVGAYVKITGVTTSKPINGSNVYTSKTTDAVGTILNVSGTLYTSTGVVLATSNVSITIIARPTITVTATPSSIYPGDSYVVNWTSVNAPVGSYVNINTDTTSRLPTDSNAYSSNPTDAVGSTVKYTAKLYNANGTLLGTGTTTVTIIIRPIVAITATPNVVIPGGTSIVNWTTSNPPANCYILINDKTVHRLVNDKDGVAIPSSAVVGTVIPYTATLYSAAGVVITSASTNITIIKQPTIGLSVDPNVIGPNEKYTVAWTTYDAPVGSYIKFDSTAATVYPTSGTRTASGFAGTVSTETAKLYSATNDLLATASASVTCLGVPSITMDIRSVPDAPLSVPNSAYPGDTYAVSWISTNAPPKSYVLLNVETFDGYVNLSPETHTRAVTDSMNFTVPLAANAKSRVSYIVRLFDRNNTQLAIATRVVNTIFRASITATASVSEIYPGQSYSISWAAANFPSGSYVKIDYYPASQRPADFANKLGTSGTKSGILASGEQTRNDGQTITLFDSGNNILATAYTRVYVKLLIKSTPTPASRVVYYAGYSMPNNVENPNTHWYGHTPTQLSAIYRLSSDSGAVTTALGDWIIRPMQLGNSVNSVIYGGDQYTSTDPFTGAFTLIDTPTSKIKTYTYSSAVVYDVGTFAKPSRDGGATMGNSDFGIIQQNATNTNTVDNTTAIVYVYANNQMIPHQKLGGVKNGGWESMQACGNTTTGIMAGGYYMVTGTGFTTKYYFPGINSTFGYLCNYSNISYTSSTTLGISLCGGVAAANSTTALFAGGQRGTKAAGQTVDRIDLAQMIYTHLSSTLFFPHELYTFASNTTTTSVTYDADSILSAGGDQSQVIFTREAANNYRSTMYLGSTDKYLFASNVVIPGGTLPKMSSFKTNIPGPQFTDIPSNRCVSDCHGGL